MSPVERADDFEARRKRLSALSDDELHARFWELAEKIVAPMVEEARTHTTPSIERSVLLRMGFSSVESKALVALLSERRLLAHGAGKLILELSQKKRIPLKEAGEGLLKGLYLEEVAP